MKNVPKLRFKEFSDEWEEKKLGELGKSIIGLTYSPDDITTKDEGILVLRSSNIRNGKLVFDDNVFINMDITRDIMVKENDILICSRNGSKALIGKSALIRKLDNKVTFGAFMTIFRSDYGKFIYQMINTRKFFKQIDMNLGSTINQITSQNLNNFKFNIPSLQEQQKIANFLTNIDKIIEKQDEKVENLEKYKKGMMQKIFSQEVRFKKDDGGEYPEWEERKLGKLGETYTGLSGKTKDNFGFGKAKYITYMNVFKNIKIDIDMVDSVDVAINETQNRVLSGDILFTTSSETPEEVGMASICLFDCKDLYLNSFCFGFRLKNIESVYGEFLVYLLRSQKIRKKITILAQGSTRYNLSKNELMKMNVNIPCLEEQQKIANFLSYIDTIIEKEKQKLEYLREWKKGLLQQMFV